MAFIVEEETGNITLIQGDSGKYPVEDVPCDKHYTAYFGIYNNKRKPVGFEVTCDIPAYNAGQIIYDKDLYCWTYSGETLYTVSTSPEVDDVLYDINNEETLSTVAGIQSISTVEGTFDKNPSDNINEYETSLYAWSNGSGISNTVYTDTDTPTSGSSIYNAEGEEIDTVYEFKNLYDWTGRYTLSENPQVNDYIYDKYGNRENFAGTGYSYVSGVGTDFIEVNIFNVLGNEETLICYRNTDSDTGIISSNTSHEDKYSRQEIWDIKEIVSVIAYAWTNSDDTIYTVNENPKTQDNVYNNALEVIDIISAIYSIIIGEDEFIRNSSNDIKKTELPDPIPTTNIEFKIPAALTNHLKVNVNEETAEYYFGIKLCSDDEEEDTLLLGDSDIGDLNTITVYPKKLEGTING